MDDLAEKLAEIMSNPAAMEKIKGLTSGLLGGNNKAKEETQKKQDNPLNMLPKDTMQNIMGILPMLNAINKEDESTRLLNSLRPFLGEERRKKLDEAIKLMNIIKLLPIIKNSGLLKI